jgi:hypothetical protein
MANRWNAKSTIYTLSSIAIKYNLMISVNETKAMAMKGKMNVGTKLVINNNIIEQVNSFTCLGYTIPVSKIRFKNKRK